MAITNKPTPVEAIAPRNAVIAETPLLPTSSEALPISATLVEVEVATSPASLVTENQFLVASTATDMPSLT